MPPDSTLLVSVMVFLNVLEVIRKHLLALAEAMRVS